MYVYTHICTSCVSIIFDVFCLLSRNPVTFVYMYRVFSTGSFNQVSTYWRVDKLLSPATYNESLLLLMVFGCTVLECEANFFTVIQEH